MWFIRCVKKFLYRNNPYFKKFFKDVSLKNLDDVVFCSLDLETTGLDVEEDEIVSIGAVKIVNFKVDFSTLFYRLVRPTIELKSNSVLIHGIIEEELETAPSVKDVLPTLLEYIKGTILLGYFVTFDIAMISKYTKKLFGFEILNPYLDLRQLYWWGLKRRYLAARVLNEGNFEDIVKELGIEMDRRHDAMCDSLASAFIFLYLTKYGVNWKKAVRF